MARRGLRGRVLLMAHAHPHDHAHGHGHSHGVAVDADQRKLAVALGLILALMLAEVVAGLVAHSLALLSDAGHMLTDAGAIALSLWRCVPPMGR
jgi:cobalt-zinc-cadmium efflux system protein